VYELLEDTNNYYISSEICDGGELYQRLKKVGKFNESDAAYIIKQVLQAINYMHRNAIVHWDLKPQNILLETNDDLEIKITDFGFSCFFDPRVGLKLDIGSPAYMAPELIQK